MYSNSEGDSHEKYIYPHFMKVGDEIRPVPDLMTIDEVVVFLRIPEVSTAKNYDNVVKNLIRARDLPRIKIGNKLLFPRQAILEWISSETVRN